MRIEESWIYEKIIEHFVYSLYFYTNYHIVNNNTDVFFSSGKKILIYLFKNKNYCVI